LDKLGQYFYRVIEYQLISSWSTSDTSAFHQATL